MTCLSFPFKNRDALWRYIKLLDLFSESLKKIEDMRMYKLASDTLVKTVKRDWHRLRREMKNCLKVFFILLSSFKVLKLSKHQIDC